MLTVIASEGYKDFVSDLQTGIKEALYDRPSKVTQEYFTGKTIIVGGQSIIPDVKQAKDIYRYLLKNDYIDDDDNITEAYRVDLENNCMATLLEALVPLGEGVHTLIQSVFDESVLKDMIENGNKTKIQENPLNDNFYKKEFQTLWGYINHQYAYTVEFDSAELIQKTIKHLNENMSVSRLQYTVTTGKQNKDFYFIAETKGIMESMNLRPIEQEKIACAKRLFNQISTSKVKYHDMDSYQSLLNKMGKF
jgi:type III restriction enzyme